MAALVERFPGQRVQKCKTIYPAQMNLGSKFGFCSCFSTYGETMGFVNTQNAIFYLMGAAHEHLELQFIHKSG